MANEFNYGGRDRLPGVSTVLETFENEFLWGDWPYQLRSGLLIDGASRDTGNTGYTHILRAGILLGLVTATNKLKPWNPAATTGEEYIWGVLKESRSMLMGNANQDRLTGPIIVAGGLLANRLIIPGNTDPGLTGNNGPLARVLLRPNFRLNDDYHLSRPAYMIHVVTAGEQGSGITLTHANSHTEYHNTGGTVTIALAGLVPAKGIEYRFRSETTTTDLITVTSGSSNIKVPGSAATNSLAVDSAAVRLYGDGSLWLVDTLG